MRRTTASQSPELDDRAPGLVRTALIVGIVAAVLAVVGLFVSGADLFFQAYLFSFMFWLGIGLGLLALLMMHYTVGTHWGLTIRRIAEAGARTLPLMALLFLPLILGLTNLYPWTRPEEVAASHFLPGKTFYLNVPFFLIRAVIYFAVWIGLAFWVSGWSTRYGGLAVDDPALRGRLQGRGALAIILYVLTMTFASIDWLMSLQPEWTSTAFGLVIIVGQVLSALAFAVLVLNLFPGLGLGRRWTSATTPVPYRDLGAFLLVFVMGWAYLAYFQLLIIWAGNIPREVVWYLARSQGGWQVVSILIALLQFALPFLILLSGRVRHNLRLLAGLGALLLVANLINMFWHVKPAFSPGVFTMSWLDLVLPVAIGGLWFAAFLYMLARRPALSTEERAVLAPTREVEEAAR